MKRTACIAILVGALGCASKPPATVAKGKSFAFPIPAGWELMTEPVPGGGVAINEKQRAYEDYFLGSVAVTAIPTNQQVDYSNEGLCKQLGPMVAAQEKVTLKGTRLVDGPTGRTCQIDVLGENNHGARATIVKGPADTWMVTCNHDPRDTAALEVCATVLATWKFE